MAIAPRSNSPDLTCEDARCIGRHNRQELRLGRVSRSQGFPEWPGADALYRRRRLAEDDDPHYAKARGFTLSLIHQSRSAKYAACHSHEVVEPFSRASTACDRGWAFGEPGGEEVIEARLGPLGHGAEPKGPAARFSQ